MEFHGFTTGLAIIIGGVVAAIGLVAAVRKLFAKDIAATIFAGLDMPRHVLWPELAIFANNPWKED